MTTAIAKISSALEISQEEVKDTLSRMIISAKNQHGSKASDAELALVSSVCAKYDLNPLVKECAAFVSSGKLQVVLMIDGWYRIVNRQPSFDGVEFDDMFDDKGNLKAITCRMYIKGRSRPVTVSEYMSECKQDRSDVWKKYPARMLRHKAYIQCARMTFGISEMIDPDEAERIKDGERDVTPTQTTTVDYVAINTAMEECATLDDLNALCVKIRADFEARGIWNSEKVILAGLKATHKSNIESRAAQRDEFEEVQDDETVVEFE